MADLIFLFVLVAFLAARLYSVFGKGGSDKNICVVLKPVNKQDEAAVKDIIQMVEAGKAVDNAADKAESSDDFNKEMFFNSGVFVYEFFELQLLLKQ